MEAFRAILERRLQLTVWTLGQAVWTPLSILIITFWSNIGLGRNWRHWKAYKKRYNLMDWKANRILQTATVRMETSSVRTALPKFKTPDAQVCRPDACARDSDSD
jgi:predicted alpha/beta hydrolase